MNRPTHRCDSDECDACERRAESRNEYEADPYGWWSREGADRYERTVLGL